MSCVRCNSSGWIVATAKSNGALYAFGCTCGIFGARGLSKQIPIWNDRLAKEYNVDFDIVFKPDLKLKTANQGKIDPSDDLPF